MSEYQRHIEFYSTHWEQNYTDLVSTSEWGDEESAEKYLQKYWLPMAEYDLEWKRIQNQIFITQKLPTEYIFHTPYELLAFRGGCLFGEEDFKKLQECFHSVGDRHFFVIENIFTYKPEPEKSPLPMPEEPPFRMKYPADITWAELISGNFISAMIVDSSNKNFFVFGETASWGRYCANGYLWPVNIVGFLPEHGSRFREKLKVPEKERLEIATEWVPPVYRPFLK